MEKNVSWLNNNPSVKMLTSIAPKVSMINLGWRLETYGIPREHVIGVERKAFMATFTASPEESEIRDRLTQLIGVYRSGQLTFDEALRSVNNELENMGVDQSLISSLLFAENIQPAEAAEGILDCAEGTCFSLDQRLPKNKIIY